LPAAVRPDAEYLHVAAKKSTHIHDDKSGYALGITNRIDLFRRICENCE
jgi:hypothetical protein